MTRLCIIISLAGAWVLLVPWIKQPVLLIADPFGMRFAVLLAAFVLFAPPLTLLGMVSPFAIRLRTKSLDEVGSVAGNIFAVSTVASVISALLTGYFLIPNIGVRLLTVAIGAILLITASIGLTARRNLKTGALVATIILMGSAVLISIIPSNHAYPERGLLALKQSPYAEIRVLDIEDLRHLLIDGGLHTVVNTASWKSHFSYVAVLDLLNFFFEKPGKLLLIGLGGGSIVKNFSQDGWTVDVVEIDPEVTKIAYKYFGVEPSEARIFNMDGRRFLSTHKEKYDIIIMDAYGSSSIPFHLVSEEAFGLISSRLRPDGVFAINIFAVGLSAQIVKSLFATLKQHFEEVIALPTIVAPNVLQNVILLASNRPLSFPEEMLRRPSDYSEEDYKHWQIMQLNSAWNHRFVPDTDNVMPLTDDLNTIDLQAEEINSVVRNQLHSYFGNKGLDW
jgi:spermidine synthase